MALFMKVKGYPEIKPIQCPTCSRTYSASLFKGKQCLTCANHTLAASLETAQQENKVLTKETDSLTREFIRHLGIISNIQIHKPGSKVNKRALTEAAAVTHGFDGKHIPANYPWLKA